MKPSPSVVTGAIHDQFVYNRRMDLLSTLISDELIAGAKVLDVGCGDGKIDELIIKRKKVKIVGVDVLVRGKTCIPVREFDGLHLPFKNNSFDTILFIDVLHHVDDISGLLAEAARVVKGNIIIKDHLLEGLGGGVTLRVMDYFGNAHYGVRLPHHYLTRKQWDEEFAKLGVIEPVIYKTKLNLYPFPFTLIFDRGLHFIVNLAID